MQTTDDTTGPTIDWRDWIAFLGYVLAAAVVISVALASVVLIVSTQVDDALPLSDASSSGRSSVPAALTAPASGPVAAGSTNTLAQTAPKAAALAVPAATPEARPAEAATPNLSAAATAGNAVPSIGSRITAPVESATSAPISATSTAAVAATGNTQSATHAAAAGPAVSFAAAADRDPRSPPTGAPQ